MRPRFSRRAALKATGRLGIGIATGSVLATNAAAGNHKFAHQLNTVRAATRKYRDVDAAKADDYERLFTFPPVGVIFGNQDYIGNLAHTDPPSLLFYAPNQAGETGNEELVLAGIEYHVFVADDDEDGEPDDPSPDIFDEENASRELKVTEAEGWHYNPGFAGGVWGLHAWVHLGNPDGVFAGPHPTIRRRLTDDDGKK